MSNELEQNKVLLGEAGWEFERVVAIFSAFQSSSTGESVSLFSESCKMKMDAEGLMDLLESYLHGPFPAGGIGLLKGRKLLLVRRMDTDVYLATRFTKGATPASRRIHLLGVKDSAQVFYADFFGDESKDIHVGFCDNPLFNDEQK